MIQIKMLPDWSILNYLNRRRPDVPEHDFLKIFGEFWVFWNSKILIILRLRFFHSGTSDSVMNKMTSNDSRMTQIWPKIDILMTLSQFHFKMVRWLNETGYRRNRIDEICSNETHSLIHWYNDLLNIPIFFSWRALKRVSRTVLRTTSRYFTKMVPRRLAPRVIFWFISEILMVKNTLFIHKWPSLKSSKVDQVLFVSLLFYIWAPRILHCWHVTSDYPITTSKSTGMANLLLFDFNLARVPSIFDECAFRGTVVCGTARTEIHLDFGYSLKWFYFRILNYFIILTS